ncbi:DEAD-box ATP-dependent RNA helicase 46 [Cucumis melo var. makuwa]|uniref:RNA helicase n=2 Tax=Cucumis melo TaxID=3656 RepID=A0A1S3B7U1_CUCME|nr:DEAD-box ATP-dependent RNA helicase 46 [Cucumis melo]XP_050939393.1 DEAD-box ATP-dependent RNA helicase 46 [Cucumis melo]TYK00823.1 DEAD-box ATP-dependent RNA helicase 46 [Cucumis melo var. makuwa]
MAATATAVSVGPRYAPEDPTLPKPWRGLVDGKTGYLYFWNPETNVTQYERPVAAAPLNSSIVSISSSVQIQKPSSGHSYNNNLNENNDKYGRGSHAPKQEVARGETFQSHDTSNGIHGAPSTGHGGAPLKGHKPSDAGSGLSADSYRQRHEITFSGDNVPAPFSSFEVTGFPPEILREVHNAGFSAPTPIQAQSWPIALQSRDIVAIAKTGSGKTLGYLIPGFIHLKRIRNDPKLGPTVLVLSPTRELATQIQDEAVKFGKSSRISCACLYGGAPKGPQLRDIDRGVDIVVATPGRLNDILEMRRISLHQVSYLVLDEADRMLDMGFEPQIRKIVKEVPARRQTLMYTATWPKEVRKIASDLLVNPIQVNIGNVDELVANKSITQHIEPLAPLEKHRRLEQILRSQEPGSKVIIFCSTKKMCDQLARNLTRQFGAAAIHGDKSQGERDHVLGQFRTGRTPVLVATDVAARGLDIKDIRVVINYDFPSGVEDYVHRIGRTGRAGATGIAYTFFGEQDAKYASDLIKILEGANQRVPPELRDMASRSYGMAKFRRWGSGSDGRDGGRGGRNDSNSGGRGGRGMSSFSSSKPERGGGRGYDFDSRDRYDSGYNRGRSRSPPRGGAGGDRTKSWNRDHSPPGWSPDRSAPARDRSPVRSFHQSMMERSNIPPRGIENASKNGSGSWNQVRSRSRSRSRSPNRFNRAPPARERSPILSFHKTVLDKGNSGGTHDNLDNKDSRRSPRDRTDGGGYEKSSRSSYPREEDEEGMIPQDEQGKGASD